MDLDWMVAVDSAAAATRHPFMPPTPPPSFVTRSAGEVVRSRRHSDDPHHRCPCPSGRDHHPRRPQQYPHPHHGDHASSGEKNTVNATRLGWPLSPPADRAPTQRLASSASESDTHSGLESDDVTFELECAARAHLLNHTDVDSTSAWLELSATSQHRAHDYSNNNDDNNNSDSDSDSDHANTDTVKNNNTAAGSIDLQHCIDTAAHSSASPAIFTTTSPSTTTTTSTISSSSDRGEIDVAAVNDFDCGTEFPTSFDSYFIATDSPLSVSAGDSAASSASSTFWGSPDTAHASSAAASVASSASPALSHWSPIDSYSTTAAPAHSNSHATADPMARSRLPGARLCVGKLSHADSRRLGAGQESAGVQGLSVMPAQQHANCMVMSPSLSEALPATVHDAATFLRLVQQRTAHDPALFCQFLQLLKLFREQGGLAASAAPTHSPSGAVHGSSAGNCPNAAGAMSASLPAGEEQAVLCSEDEVRTMAERVIALLHSYPDLVLGFNQFLPETFAIAIHPHYLSQPAGYQPTADDPPPYVIMRQPVSSPATAGSDQGYDASMGTGLSPAVDSASQGAFWMMPQTHADAGVWSEEGNAETTVPSFAAPYSLTHLSAGQNASEASYATLAQAAPGHDFWSRVYGMAPTVMPPSHPHPPSLDEAKAFLHQVKRRAQEAGCPDLYSHFKDIIRRRRSGGLKVNQVVTEVGRVFDQHFPDLWISFHRFLPQSLPDTTTLVRSGDSHQDGSCAASIEMGHRSSMNPGQAIPAKAESLLETASTPLTSQASC